MNKQVLSGMGLGAVLLFILIGAGVYVSSQQGNVPDENESSISQAAATEFIDEMREGTVARVGQPIEGFEPFMFMQAFPGLTANDFDGVDALIGIYRYQNGEVVYDLNGEPELHSAARAISDEGMIQLLVNVSTRLNYNLSGDETVTDVIAAISAAHGADPTNPAAGGGIEPTLFGTKLTFGGTIVCLPHKGGPATTMECAYGLKADNGSYYGLTNLYSGSHAVDLRVGERVEVTGILREPRAEEVYKIVGVIDVEQRWPISPSV